MSEGSIAFLAFQAAAFIVWTVMVFRWLFALRADAVAESGSAMPGLAPTLRAFRGALVDARYAKERVRVGFLTLLLLVGSSFAPFVL